MDKGSREHLLYKDLINYNPNKWRINLPFVHYSLKLEDIIPALSGGIGKIALVAAFAVAWARGFNIVDPSFVTENVRLELMIGGLFTILFSAVWAPHTAPPGTLAPIIPLIPIIVAAGVHPLPLSLLIGIIGIIISSMRGFKKVITLNGQGTTAGIILLFGLLGTTSSLESLRSWSAGLQVPLLANLLIISGILMYVFLNRIKAKYLMIPFSALLALILSGLFGIYPQLTTSLGVPILSPTTWWYEKWGIGFGMNINNFIKAFPFALLAVAIWPIDALAIKKIQEANYPKEANKALFNMDDTYIIVALRNIAGALMGGGQIASIWRSFMIPLATVKRPIVGSALVLGIIGILFGLLGFPIDIAVFPPLLWLVLIVGVYIPLLEVGLNAMKTVEISQVAITCIIIGIAINPIIGWVVGLLIENFNMLGPKDTAPRLSKQDKWFTLIIILIITSTYVYTYSIPH
ncbi:DUF3360 family protein [Cellulosilyticum sp. I15G10I2]|uniref:DUF3360 family protein n=1 Tax=Cellulosilyticum sp. I15G10I2 TaxID=1892843 RepID=UPI00085C2E4B|nr:DUF3360 family protein [Cellulosilyticum sp. I15G10I2]